MVAGEQYFILVHSDSPTARGSLVLTTTTRAADDFDVCATAKIIATPELYSDAESTTTLASVDFSGLTDWPNEVFPCIQPEEEIVNIFVFSPWDVPVGVWYSLSGLGEVVCVTFQSADISGMSIALLTGDDCGTLRCDATESRPADTTECPDAPPDGSFTQTFSWFAAADTEYYFYVYHFARYEFEDYLLDTVSPALFVN